MNHKLVYLVCAYCFILLLLLLFILILSLPSLAWAEGARVADRTTEVGVRGPGVIVDDELILRFTDNVSQSAIDQLLVDYGLVVEEIAYSKILVVLTPAG